MIHTGILFRKELVELLDYSEELHTLDINTAYFERFSTCVHVRDVICSDHSCYSKCPEGAYGKSGGQPMEIPWDICSACLRYRKK